MKKFIFLLLISLKSSAQFTTVFQPMTWHNEVHAVAEANGFYYVAGNCRNSMNGITKDVMFLTTLDANGSIYNQYYSDSSAPGTLSEMHCRAMEPISGGFILAGDSDSYFYVVKIDDFGNWQWSYVGTLLSMANEIVPTNYGYVVSGDSGTVALDLNGNLIWQAPLFGDITGIPNGIISSTYPGILEINAVDSNGLNPWSQNLGIQQVKAPRITSTSTNIYVVGFKQDSIFMACTDLWGTLQWIKCFWSHNNTDWINEIHTGIDGIIIGGFSQGHAILMYTDFSGNLKWLENYQVPDCGTETGDGIQSSNGNIFWAGSQFNYVDQISNDFAILGIDSIYTSNLIIEEIKPVFNLKKFNLQGQEIKSNNSQGIYIQNRKKFFKNN